MRIGIKSDRIYSLISNRSNGGYDYLDEKIMPSPEQTPLLKDDDLDESRGAPEYDDETLDAARKRKRAKPLRWVTSAPRWTWKHRLVLAILLLLIGGIVALVVYFAVFDKNKAAEVSPSICLTPACVQAAANVINNMSPRYSEIDPCENFDKYACDGFVASHDLRADQSSLFTYTVMAERGAAILHRLLESPPAATSTGFGTDSGANEAIFKKLKDAYDACMDEDKIKSTGSAPLLSILEKLEDLFPASGTEGRAPTFSAQDKGSASHLSRTVAYLATLDVDALVSFSVGADDKDPDNTIITIDAPRAPGLSSKEYYKDSKLVAQYAETIGQVLEALLEEDQSRKLMTQLLGPNFSTKNAELVKELVTFESRLAEATPDEEDAEDVTKYYNIRSIEEADELLPQLSIPQFISHFAPSGCKPQKLIVASPSYLKAVAAILEGTSNETLLVYFTWKIVQSYTSTIEDKAVKPLKRFNNVQLGKDPDAEEERWRTCIKNADGSLGWILSKFFVEEAFSKEAKEFGDRIVSEIKAQFVLRLGDALWMSQDVRKEGIKKVHNIIQKIGYPIASPDLRNSTNIWEYYKDVKISKHSFFDNALSVAHFDTEQEWGALCKPTDRAEWDMTADTVNAYYNPAGNEIVFPAGIMQAPIFYAPSVPQYLSYGAFGAVSGHELSHAFDSTGRHYDEIGNYTDWWDENTIQSFEHKAQCFVDQYSKFTVEKPDGGSLHVNGRLTLGENIADAGGSNAAFAAWKQNDEKNPDQLLPGLQQFTKEQLFFISYSSFWCGKVRPETAVNLIYRDPHSPSWARILGTMANSPNFRKAFSCPVKEPTCELW